MEYILFFSEVVAAIILYVSNRYYVKCVDVRNDDTSRRTTSYWQMAFASLLLVVMASKCGMMSVYANTLLFLLFVIYTFIKLHRHKKSEAVFRKRNASKARYHRAIAQDYLRWFYLITLMFIICNAIAYFSAADL